MQPFILKIGAEHRIRSGSLEQLLVTDIAWNPLINLLWRHNVTTMQMLSYMEGDNNIRGVFSSITINKPETWNISQVWVWVIVCFFLSPKYYLENLIFCFLCLSAGLKLLYFSEIIMGQWLRPLFFGKLRFESDKQFPATTVHIFTSDFLPLKKVQSNPL